MIVCTASAFFDLYALNNIEQNSLFFYFDSLRSLTKDKQNYNANDFFKQITELEQNIEQTNFKQLSVIE